MSQRQKGFSRQGKYEKLPDKCVNLHGELHSVFSVPTYSQSHIQYNRNLASNVLAIDIVSIKTQKDYFVGTPIGETDNPKHVQSFVAKYLTWALKVSRRSNTSPKNFICHFDESSIQCNVWFCENASNHFLEPICLHCWHISEAVWWLWEMSCLLNREQNHQQMKKSKGLSEQR